MFKKLAITLSIAIILAWIWYSNSWKPRDISYLYRGRKLPIVCGHRGAAGLAPENTLTAFKEAQRVGAGAVEFDVMLTADGQVVVFHDQDLSERLLKRGRVSQLTLEQLRRLVSTDLYFAYRRPLSELKAWNSTVPTLSEVFQFYRKYPQVILNVELKTKEVRGRGLEEKVASEIRRFNYEKRVLISSFNPFALWRIRKAAPELARALLYSPDNAIYLRQLWFISLARPDALNPREDLVDREYLRWARAKGFRVNTWTVNRPQRMRELIQLQVDMIITDYPNILKRFLQN